jgi:hypothetical protein
MSDVTEEMRAIMDEFDATEKQWLSREANILKYGFDLGNHYIILLFS